MDVKATELCGITRKASGTYDLVHTVVLSSAVTRTAKEMRLARRGVILK
jgi:hypothetical protein